MLPPAPTTKSDGGAESSSTAESSAATGKDVTSTAATGKDGAAGADTDASTKALSDEVQALKLQNAQLMAKIEDQQKAAAQEAVRAFRNVRLNAEKQFKWLFDLQATGAAGAA